MKNHSSSNAEGECQLLKNQNPCNLKENEQALPFMPACLHLDPQTKEDVRRGFLGINSAYSKIRGVEAGAIFDDVKFEDITVRIPLKVAEEIDIPSLRWIILGTGDPPNMKELPEGSKIYHRG